MGIIDYPSLVNSIREHAGLARLIQALNRALTALGYVSYPLLVVLAALMQQDFLLPCIVVPGCSFILVTVLRYMVDETRPFVKLSYDPLLTCDKTGRSFPSRHAFCMFMIAASWLAFAKHLNWTSLPIDIFMCVLFVSAVLLALIRVLSGVHYLKDVIAGALFALILAHIGYVMIFG